jgi:dipeptidyl aminopeptidase/acylaminoacyl peptidase
LASDISADGKTLLFSETGAAVGANYGVFLRPTDGSPAVRLGDGGGGILSPDGKWVVAVSGSPGKLSLLPTGVGEVRQLTDDKSDHFPNAWTPDGKSIVTTVTEPGHPARSYLLDIASGSTRPITPEGVFGGLLTPDGKFLLAIDANRQRWLYPLAGGEPQKLDLKLAPNERVVHFLGDDHTLLTRTTEIPSHITRLDIATGRREPWKDIDPSDAAGLQTIVTIRFSADAKSYAYSTFRVLSDLYVVSGMR